MTEASYFIRGRRIDDPDIETIRELIRESGYLGRMAISMMVCERWDWRESNGRLKDRACRVLLLTLERQGVVELPPRLRIRHSFNRKTTPVSYEVSQEAISGKVSNFRSLIIKMVRFTRRRSFGTIWFIRIITWVITGLWSPT